MRSPTAGIDEGGRYELRARHHQNAAARALGGAVLDNIAAQARLAFFHRLGSSWSDLADYVGVPSREQKRWAPGDKAKEVWQWLEERDRLSILPQALRHIDRDDLVSVVEAAVASTSIRRMTIGVIPSLADCRQDRRIDRDLADLVKGGGDTVVVCQVLAGMGGVGKTQLAAALARNMWTSGEVDLLVWVTATSRQAILVAFAQAGEALMGYSEGNPEQGTARFLAWLSEQNGHRWLIVLDDLQFPADLNGLWPPRTPLGRTVVTTRRRDATLLRDRLLVDVGLFSPTESTSYLTNRLDRDTRKLAEAELLGADLGHLPLALAQAAAYILVLDLTCADYRQRLRDVRRTLEDLAPDTCCLPDGHEQSVAATWSISIDHADTLRPRSLARPSLELAALLDPNGIPESVFFSDTFRTFLGRVFGHSGPVRPDDIRDVLHNLGRLSLISRNAGDPTVRVHALLQRAVRESAEPGRIAELTRVAGDAVAAVWPRIEKDAAVGQMLRANVSALAAVAGTNLWTANGMHRVLLHAGTSLGESGLASEAATYFRDLRAAAIDRLGPHHVHTLTVRSSYARWQGEAGDTRGAAGSAESLLADQIRVLGPGHPGTLVTRGILIRWQGESGDAPGAFAATQALVRDRLRVLGPDHTHTLTARHNLGYWQGESGDAVGAAELFEDLHVDMVRVLGPDHPDTLTTRNDLAWWRGKAGDPGGAAHALAELLEDRRRVLGPDHPHTLITRNDLAWWQGLAGDAARAKDAFERLLPDIVRVLGPDHPRTMTTRNNLAWWRGANGDTRGAVAAFRALLVDRLRVLGPDHPHTMITRGSLAYWRGSAGDPGGAVHALEELLEDRMRVMPDHPHTRTTRNHLAFWRNQLNGTGNDSSSTETLMANIHQVLGPDHPDTLTIWSDVLDLDDSGWSGSGY